MTGNLYWGAELAVYARLQECSVVSIVASLIIEFEVKTGAQPSIIRAQRKLKGAVIREVAERMNWEPQKLVSEPIWFGRVPVVFNLKEKEEEWLIARHGSIGFTMVI